MRVSARPFADARLMSVISDSIGYHDVTWISNDSLGVEAQCCVDAALTLFLAGVRAMVRALPDGSDYTYGTAYYRVMAADDATPGGRFHYDTGLDHPTVVRDAGSPVLRFTAADATHMHPISNVFSADPSHHGLTYEQVIGRSGDLTQPGNRIVTLFSEGLDLHARPASDAMPGHRKAFFSATLYTAAQRPDLSCPALTPLRGTR